MKKTHSLPLRLWHWFNAVAIFGLLGTVLLRKTFLSYRSNAVWIESKAAEAGVMVSPDLAKTIARTIRDVMWEWHYIFGFSLIALFVFRVILVFATGACPRKEAFGAWKAYFSSSTPAELKTEVREVALARSGQLGFYVLTLVMSVTGLAMYFSEKIGLSKETFSSIKECHELLLWGFVVFVAAHLFGVVKAELTGHRGLVSDMIHGGDQKK